MATFQADIARWNREKTVTLDVRPPSTAMADFTAAWKSGKGARSARISFATPECCGKC